jgi:hypothetical protein
VVNSCVAKNLSFEAESGRDIDLDFIMMGSFVAPNNRSAIYMRDCSQLSVYPHLALNGSDTINIYVFGEMTVEEGAYSNSNQTAPLTNPTLFCSGLVAANANINEFVPAAGGTLTFTGGRVITDKGTAANGAVGTIGITGCYGIAVNELNIYDSGITVNEIGGNGGTGGNGGNGGNRGNGGVGDSIAGNPSLSYLTVSSGGYGTRGNGGTGGAGGEEGLGGKKYLSNNRGPSGDLGQAGSDGVQGN